MSLLQIYKNTIWRLETLTPSSAISLEPFRHNDHPLHMTAEQSMADRLFTLEWDRGDEVQDLSDLNQRWSDIFLILEFGYDAARDLDEHYDLMLADRNQIISTLRNGASFVGFDADNTATDINLKARWFENDEQDRDLETVRILRQTWRCRIAEDEL